VAVSGVSRERRDSLHRQKNAVVAKAVFAWPDSFWELGGQNGSVYMETGLIGGTWTQREGIMSTLVPPERLGPFLATPEELLEDVLVEEMVGRLVSTHGVCSRRSFCGAGASILGRVATSPRGDRGM
jgi:hypothetical protein